MTGFRLESFTLPEDSFLLQDTFMAGLAHKP
jgi:hypothetical protein